MKPGFLVLFGCMASDGKITACCWTPALGQSTTCTHQAGPHTGAVYLVEKPAAVSFGRID
eukprot:scaffold534344_cov33-Prasinocladus_malaysianus.AAC.1